MSEYILPLDDKSATLASVGGKGMSLAKLAAAGLPVPDGFHLTTEAYRYFVEANGLQPLVLATLRELRVDSPDSLSAGADRISKLFAEARIPEEISSAIDDAWRDLCVKDGRGDNTALAVRSSATAEDLPEASFAGQQESYLNVRGREALLVAVKKCWASLWTARAIAYRSRQEIPQDLVYLAVVVQELVAAEASGVMFTANPVTGNRNELMITATWGLGEAIVSGAVTPDTLTLAKGSCAVKFCDIAMKLRMTVCSNGGTRDINIPWSRRKKPVLTNEQARELAALGIAIEELYAMPMDIEWTLARGRFAIVQARPITALPSPTEDNAAEELNWPMPDPKAILARGSFAEFVPEPVSPLFATLAVPIAKQATLRLMASLGVTEKESYIFSVINDYVYVGFRFTPKMIWQFLKATIVLFPKLIKTAGSKAAAAKERILQTTAAWEARRTAELTPAEILQGSQEIFGATAEYYTVAQSGSIPTATMSEGTFGTFYKTLVKRKGDPDSAQLLFGTENQALRSEKALFDLAIWARSDVKLEKLVRTSTADEIWRELQAKPAPSGLQEFSRRFQVYLHEYGQTIYDLDFAKPVPVEDPRPQIETLKIYLDGKKSPYERQKAAVALRQQTVASIVKRLDPIRRKYFLKYLNWALDTAPLREDSISEMGLGYPQLRSMLHELGRRLVEAGVITDPEDVYWLEFAELQEMAPKLEKGRQLQSEMAEVESRKARWQRMRKISAPSTLPQKSWMSRFFPSNEGPSMTIKGFGASAGKVTSRACVMLGPEDFDKMQSGDIIVAGITTPAWTPLFTRAGGIVTDIGGPLSHSSIVAREYGIPAVLATGNGTRRIRDGHRITVDGGAGKVTLHAN